MHMRSMMAAISAAVAMGAANAVANTWYVSPEGGGDGSDREHPTDAQTAFKALNASTESDNVIVFLKGDYYSSATHMRSNTTDGKSWLAITKNQSTYTIRGETGNPEDVIFRDGSVGATRCMIIFASGVKGVVSGLTFEGFGYTGTGGGCAYGTRLDTSGGTSDCMVSNCVFRYHPKNPIYKASQSSCDRFVDCTFLCNTGSVPTVSGTGGATVAGCYRCWFEGNCRTGTSNGSVCRGNSWDCVFTNNTSSKYIVDLASSIHTRGVFIGNNSVVASGAVLSNCLVACNNAAAGYQAKFVGCTIVSNKNYGIVTTSSLVAENCIIVGHPVPPNTESGGDLSAGSGDYAKNCYFGTHRKGTFHGENCTRGMTVETIKFAPPDEKHPWGWALRRTSPCIGEGCAAGYDAADIDCAGLPRLGPDGKLDVGCYQYVKKVGLLMTVK